MAASAEFIEFLKEQMADFGEVTHKRMFGGAGLYFEGKMFGLIDDDCVYLRVDDATRPRFEARGFNAMSHRPTVRAIDAPLLAWRALWMRRAPQRAPLAGPAAR